MGGVSVQPNNQRQDPASRRRTRQFRRAARNNAAPARHKEPELTVDVEALRGTYDDLMAGGINRFFEPRRTECPGCEAQDLQFVLTSYDLIGHKPGRFTLDRCQRCRRVFQNPRLTGEGLDFYYRDIYDGLGAKKAARRSRLAAVTAKPRLALYPESAPVPASWLDVGCGDGHMCRVGQTVMPGTRFEGLDRSEAVERAARRGWVSEGHRCSLQDLVRTQGCEFDVVSMFHFLEHTVVPEDDLDAAVALLAPGGHLIIEVPDPECGFGRLWGQYWLPWFQPEHLNLLAAPNLTELLAARGLEIVNIKRGVVPVVTDGMTAASLALLHWAPPPLPWLARPTWKSRLRRAFAYAALVPIEAVAFVVDQVLFVCVSKTWRSAAYNVVARKPERSEASTAD